MNTKFPIFVVIASVIALAVYNSSINLVSAKGDDLTMATCIISADKSDKSNCTLAVGGVSTNYDCNADAITKKWSCVKATETAKTASDEQRRISAADLLREMQLKASAGIRG